MHVEVKRREAKHTSLTMSAHPRTVQKRGPILLGYSWYIAGVPRGSQFPLYVLVLDAQYVQACFNLEVQRSGREGA
jgi:hypothetical protein